MSRNVWGKIDGRTISFPLEVPKLRAATLMYDVDAALAQSLIPGRAFEVTEVQPGRAQMVIALVDYQDNPWGTYNEVNLAFLAGPSGRPEEIGSFVYRMPVDEEFTCRAGRRVLGVPKTVERIDVIDADNWVEFVLFTGAQMSAAIRLPKAPGLDEKVPIETLTYSYLDGVPTATPLRMDMGTGAVPAEQVEVMLGQGPVADELRLLGIEKGPQSVSWGEGLGAVFEMPYPLGDRGISR